MENDLLALLSSFLCEEMQRSGSIAPRHQMNVVSNPGIPEGGFALSFSISVCGA
jgi:hypothetical protein